MEPEPHDFEHKRVVVILKRKLSVKELELWVLTGQLPEDASMPEPPDFEQIARRLLDDLPDAFLTRGADASSAIPGVVEQLRQVWNARGAADLAKIDATLSSLMGVTASGPYVKNLARALKILDR